MHALAAIVTGALLAPSALQADVLRDVRTRGVLVCGVNGTLPGFSMPDAQGAMRGMDADFCRAVAAAVLGDASKVRYVRIATPDDGFRDLGDRRIDLLARNTTWTFLREVTQPIEMAGITLFDGQAVLVSASAPIASLRHLSGRRVCITSAAGSEADEVLTSAAAALGIQLSIVEAGFGEALLQALRDGRCDAASTDYSQLAVRRVTEMPNPSEWKILPELLSREPLALVVPAEEDAWRHVVFWVLQAMLEADELGVTSQNLVQFVQSNDPSVRRLVGIDAGLGGAIGLDDLWSQRVLSQVGSYGEVFERNLGSGSIFGLDRGWNDNWQRGGLMFPLPLR